MDGSDPVPAWTIPSMPERSAALNETTPGAAVVALELERADGGKVVVGSPATSSRVRPEEFRVIAEIGTGAFGRVTLVRHGPTRREFAMKAISKKVLRRKKVSQREWRLERDVLVRIEPHPYVVELVCAFQTTAYFFLVMTYLSGGELFSVLRSRGTFPEDVAGFYAAEVSLALEHLHASGVIHRDLKPENLLLDADGHVVVTDFGLAKMFESSDDEVHRTLCGTDVYMAPEMVARRAYGKAVDFWSLGVLIYEMLTGKTPFQAPSTKDLHRKILTDKVKFPPFVSKDAISCLRGLLERQVPKRLGATKATMFQVGGLAALKQHAFFSRIEWQPLARREAPAPFKVPAPKATTLDDARRPPIDVFGALDGLSSRALSDASDDASTVRDFEYCREGIFNAADEASKVFYDSPTSSQCDVSSACTNDASGSKKKKGPRKRKKKHLAAPSEQDSSEPATPTSDVSTDGSPARATPPPRLERRLESIPGSPHVGPLEPPPVPALCGPALDDDDDDDDDNPRSQRDKPPTRSLLLLQEEVEAEVEPPWIEVAQQKPHRRVLKPVRR
ncbi:hypothetical protein CTAYLR_004724 [Chrysophaeum taylorii]|uniref:Protein kinase domain-containing protein n=1 Tax=Chrysophaeum taylorii TaxID=2483200 RepID=A0AAD7U7T2_9STRA|nr:hypothetical protein CTAYLR_004724 [Chrysophaeum taylorii]